MRFKRAILAAFAVASFPAAAFAGHFYIVHPLSWIPSAENILFWDRAADDADEDDRAPSSEQYLIDQMLE